MDSDIYQMNQLQLLQNNQGNISNISNIPSPVSSFAINYHSAGWKLSDGNYNYYMHGAQKFDPPKS